jgi:hypothetical protein
VTPRGPKLYDHALLTAYRTSPIDGEPAELWELGAAYRDDPVMVALFADARMFLELHRLACLPRLVDARDHTLLVVAPPWVGLDVLSRSAAARGGLELGFVIAYVRALAHELAMLPATVLLRSLDPDSLAITIEGRPRLLDLTLAKFEGRRSVTQPGVVKGIPAFMSPELVQGNFASSRSDVFALGLVAYELLAGRRVFTGEPINVMQAIASDPLPDIRDDRDDLPMDFVLVLERMLQRRTRMRPLWREIADALAPMDTWTAERVVDELRAVAPAAMDAAIVYGL